MKAQSYRSMTIKQKLIHNSRFDLRTGCLNWQLRLDKDGYGSLKIGRRVKRAHRVALELKLGRELSDEEQGLHTCNNPACISVAINHVYLGDHKTNMAQAAKDGLMPGYVPSPTRRAWGTGRARDL